MSASIICKCIDDSNRPNEIPISEWVKKDAEYHVTHIYNMQFQGFMVGVELAELDISKYPPYNCFKISRFLFRREDLDALGKMIKRCSDLNKLENIDIQKFVDEIPSK